MAASFMWDFIFYDIERGWENADGKCIPTRTTLSPKGDSCSNSNLLNIKKDADMTEDLQLGLCDHQHISIVTCSYVLTVLLILNAECVLLLQKTLIITATSIHVFISYCYYF
jgi:hypothetical protein